MKRLTEKNEFGYILHIKPVDNSIGDEIAIVGETANKLGELEDLMEKYHIEDLEALDDALLENYLNIKSKFPLEK